MTTDAKKPKQRSPSYPSVDLGTAVERTRQLWTHAQRYPVPVTDAMKLWGYSAKSSGGLLTIAALKKYGLAEDEGSGSARMLRVSDEGRAIVLDEQDSPQRRAKLQKAALTPAIHQELWDYGQGSIPPDSTLRFYLINDRAFTENGAREALDVYKRTVEFAGLSDEDGNLSRHVEDTELANPPSGPPSLQIDLPVSAPRPSPVQPLSTQMPTTAPPPIQFPVYGGGTVILQSTVPFTEASWEQMMTVLNTLKPAVIAPDLPVDSGDAD